ncbi:RNA chaperone Hfq [Bacillus cereus BAG1X2-3]|uniref:RNA chaperone Hfq n=1 Tax=Bacillus cereus TaxID=1396 RepID=A0A9X7E105_BACCE|nr:RNA chaperone Hfq [Bacillus cereus]EOO23293.1 RNA chaperone Hfq [Bacillus cereus BAG1X1-1]EOO42858.1 RNA chaperone Hfq [Bacillus cereus BAG1X2-1]EOO56411.1 RNA chaperone Hfq [Bacillus cereus BAG1X2-3]EOP00118.1 RNA chaperone Hfq [Bacillus cereus BAG2O-1]PHA19187.1 RNA chaperone Hfq [Bacillus cereus]
MYNLQEDMYEQLKDKKGDITIFLKSGVPLHGQILATDKFTVLMTVHGKQQLVYKQVIFTIIK